MFWDKFSILDEETDQVTQMNWSQAIQLARKIRREIDEEDAKQASIEFPGDGTRLNREFSYKKGGELKFLQDIQTIAKKYRELKNCPRPWDKKN